MGAGDTELRRDLGDGVRPAPVRAFLLVHALGEFHLSGAELRFLPAGAPTGTGGGQAVHRALGHFFTVGGRGQPAYERAQHLLIDLGLPAHCIPALGEYLCATQETEASIP